MCRLKSQHCQLLIKNMLYICLLISPCLGAAELATPQRSAGLLYQDENGVTLSAPLLKSSAEMHVNGLINRVTVTQIFKNESNNWINADYLFPLPENAAVDHLSIATGGRLIIAEIREKSEAQKGYSLAKNAGKKASLIEQLRSNIFSSAVANIAPEEEVKIEIEYQQTIDYKEGVFSLHYPMAITPRYAPAMARLSRAQRDQYLSCLADGKNFEQHQQLCAEKWNRWLKSMEDQQLARKTAVMVKNANDPDLRMEINVYLHSPSAIKNINSPYNNIIIEKPSPDLQFISLQGDAVRADRDFVLNWQLAQGEASQSVLFVQEREAEKYGALMLLPPAQPFIKAARINKEVIFVIDVSGSMAGSPITQAKASLSFAIDQLAENDSFNIISFSDHSDFFAGNALPVDRRSKEMAKVYIDQLQASGGTNMQSVLHAAFTGPRTVHPNPEKGLRQIVFITDASISNEEQLLTQIKQQLGDSRLFMVGIGSAPNRYFMKASVNLGKGIYINIADVNEVQRKMSALFAQLSTPVLCDIQLHWVDGSEVDYWPRPIRDLYQGEPLQLVFKIPEMQKALHLSGVGFEKNRAEQWSQDVALQQQYNAHGVDVLWAKTQIDSLELNRELSDTEKKQKITALGEAFHIVTKHTSLLAVDQNASRPTTLDSINMQVKTHLPQGTTMRLPQTGLASEFYKQLGFAVFLLAAVLWCLQLTFPLFSREGR